MKSKRKRVDSDGLLQKKARAGGKNNPFETVMMTSKHAVLNRGPQSKQPSAIRKRAIDTRKQTLGKEFATLHKTNRFMDARKGGKNAQQPSNKAQRKEMYNLSLTHRGQTLAELDNLDDVIDDDNDNDEESGMLNDDFTRATHFGGGSDDERETRRKDRKSVIEEMIAESKRIKSAKQRDNDLVFEKSQELDKDLQLLMSKVGTHIRKDNERPQQDDYDLAMRELVFERRGAPAEKLKSEQLARTEQARRERLERERLERMKNEEIDRGKDKTRKHLSADALDDGYLLDDDDNGPVQDDDNNWEKDNGYDPRMVSQEAAGKSSTIQDDSDEKGSESDDIEDEDLASCSDADSLSDLKHRAQASDEEEKDEGEEPEEKTREQDKPTQSIPMALIPRFIEIPKQYEDFVKMLEQYTVEQQAVVVEKIVQRANENNPKAKAQRSVVFVYIIQHLVDRFTASGVATIQTDFKALHLLTPHLYDLAQKDPEGISTMFQDILQEKYGEFQQTPNRHPSLASLIILKLIPLLFSASDARHMIVTPGLVFMSELLTRCPIRNRRQIARGLLMVTTVLECVEHSKRFLPATLSFLSGVINLACPPAPPHVSAHCVHPFKASAVSLLPAADDDVFQQPSGGLKLTAEDLMLWEITDSFKVRSVATAVSMISTIATQLADRPAIQTIAKSFLNQLDGLEKVNYPAKVKKMLQKTRFKLAQLADRAMKFLVAAEQKPKPLRLLEPKVEPVYGDVRGRPKTELSLREQRKKLIQKVKKEKRGAAREIRLDNEYLAKLKHKRRMESDRERKEKVRRIFSDATTQQAELNSLDRKAKYRK